MDANFWAIIGSAIAVVTFLYTYLRNFKADMDSRFDDFKVDMDRRSERFENKFIEIEQRILESNKRMDGVYTILLNRIENLGN